MPDVKERWTGPGRFAPAPNLISPVEVADSWLVDDGRCRGLDLHRARFTRSCGGGERFFDDVVARLPRSGRWFPRVELAQGEFTVQVRPAPPIATEVALRLPGVPDPRRRPSVKGPDLETLVQLRAQTGDGREPVLLSPEGWVREGALSSLMWWRGEVLCAPPEGPGLLPSVTRALVLQIAAGRAQEVRFEQVQAEELAGLECWSMSALHGIRSTGNQVRREAWQAELLGLAAEM
ncbi:aminotransferase class IV [Kineosporia babensis]|uniref:Aminotransferase class IV n=1 Tax=Kineosporia babensis TaxID=499548 RepID=A0A9X1SYR2_9ACTN|nr:aminotransferase class IV [Kineosporia babensis]MCD5311233.1 aminotransferase class IV [Kineosporia babensis]